MSKSIYKFLNITPDKEGNVASFNVLGNATLKFTSPIDFNDPFDSFPVFGEKLVTTMSDLYHFDLEKYLKISRLNQNSKTGLEMLAALNRNYHDNALRRFFTGETKVTCLSTAVHNVLMWSHYADHHKGFACEFEHISDNSVDIDSTETISDKTLTYNLYPNKINYVKNRPIVDLDTISVEKIFLTKSIDWKYEDEYRVFDHSDSDNGIVHFNPIILKSVILGVYMSDHNKKCIKFLVQQFNKKHKTQVKIKQARLDDSTYKILID